MLFNDMMMKFKPRLPSMVCSIGGDGGAGDGTGGGAGDGTGGAAGDGKGGAGDGTFNAEQFQTEMKDFVVRAVNGAVSTHLTRALDNKLQENNQGLLGQIKEMIGTQPQGGAGDSAPGAGAGNSEIDAAIKNATAPLMKQLEEQRALNERNAAQAKAERETRMRQEEMGQLSSALTGAGVAGPLAQAACNLLHASLERDADGKIVFVAQENGPTGPYEERVAVAEGVARYLKTEDGKHFMPAREAGGSGNRGGKAGTAGTAGEGDGEFVGRMMENLFG